MRRFVASPYLHGDVSYMGRFDMSGGLYSQEICFTGRFLIYREVLNIGRICSSYRTIEG